MFLEFLRLPLYGIFVHQELFECLFEQTVHSGRLRVFDLKLFVAYSLEITYLLAVQLFYVFFDKQANLCIRINI